MTQGEIAKILQDNYPRYMSYRDIAKECPISHRSIMRCLSRLQKCNEIEFKMIEKDHPNTGWKKIYRSRGGL